MPSLVIKKWLGALDLQPWASEEIFQEIVNL